MSGLISKNNFSSSTLEALKKIDKSQYGNQDGNISIGELKKSITDEKGNISKEKLNSLGITNQKDIDVISKEYKVHKTEPNKVFFSESEKVSSEVLKKDNVKSLTFIIDKIKQDRGIIDKHPNLVKDLNSIKHNFNTINQADLQKKLKGYINIVNSDKSKESNKLNNHLEANPTTGVKHNSLNKLNEKKEILLKEQKINLDIFSGKTAKTVLLSDNLEMKNYLNVINKFKYKVSNIQPLSAPISEIRKYAASSGSPRSSSDIKYLYMSKLTAVIQPNGKSLNDSFRDNIINSKKDNLDISDVLNSALEVTNGDYSMAVATVSNTFKSATYELRDIINLPEAKDQNSFFTKEYSANPDDFTKDLKMIKKLGNLRSDKSNGDKMGMWYHFFNVQSMSSFYGNNVTNIGIGLEHFTRDTQPLHKLMSKLHINNDAVSPVDNEKAKIDNLSLNIFNEVLRNHKK